MIQSFSEVFQTLTFAGTLGTICSICFIIFLICKKKSSHASLTCAIGSLISFFIGNSFFAFPAILIITWGNVIGIIGGYVLIMLALFQYWFDRTKGNNVSTE